MSKQILGYDQNGRAIEPIGPGMLATAALVVCSKCQKVIRSAGGPSHGALCVEHSNKRLMLDKTYTAEALSDLDRDMEEAFDERFTPEAAGIPKDEHGFEKGHFRVQITWINEE
jgi:hypothetical protein